MSKRSGPVLRVAVSDADLQELAGEWTPRRCLYLARAGQIEALCRVLNRVVSEGRKRGD